MTEYVVYVLFSPSANRLYIGFSGSSIERFHFHNTKSKKGFTLRYRPWQMIHIEFFDTKSAALQREKTLKSGKGREWIRTTYLL